MIRVLKAFFKYFSLILLPLVTVWATYFFLYGNFHKVDNDVYRSAQLFSFNMPYYTKENGIKSILNLRGKNDEEWYNEEIRFAQENNLTHYNYGIPDRRVISIKQMNDIVEIIKKAPKPILIHCKMGADRTSLAVALYLYAIKKDKNPYREISLLYGHFPWLGSKTKAMDRSFEVFISN